MHILRDNIMNTTIKKVYLEENNFNIETFKNPPVSYAPFYNWIWNAPVTTEETDKQLDEMLRLGIKAFAIIPEPKNFRPNSMPTFLEPDYLTPDYFEAYKYTVLAAQKRGMLVCLYDEGGWPSGSACGKIMQKHPEFVRRSIAKRNKCYKKDDIYTLSEDTIIAFHNDIEITKGHIFENDCEVTEYFIFCDFNPDGINLPDLTLKEATNAFIKETHEGYKPYLKEFFGDVISTVFTDEPTAPRKIPYRKEIEELFQKENGYSIRPFLPEIMENRKPTTEGINAKLKWLDICSRLFCNNFLLTEKEWTNKNNMAFIGHMDIDHVTSKCCTDSGNFNLMRSLRCFDIPGIDVIWQQITNKPQENPREETENINGIFPRFASSAAAQIGSRYSLTESFGVYGAGTTFNLMRYVVNYQAVRGINMFNYFAIPYGREGFLMTGELPYFTEKHACYKDLSVFNKYCERLSYLASLGEREANVALYMPVCDLQAEINKDTIAKAFDKTAKELEKSRILFDIADDDVFEYVNKGKIKMGVTLYDTVIVPPCEFMPPKTKLQLEKFILEGGTVYVIGDNTSINGAKQISNATNILPSPIELSGDTDMLRLNIRNTENGKLIMLYNESDETKSFEVISEYKYIIDAENAKIIKPNSNKIILSSGQMVFLWQGAALEFEKENTYTNQIILDNFTIRKSERFIIGENEFETQKFTENELAVSLGDWSQVVGKDFSGSCIYKTEFVLPENTEKILLDLGDVYSSCEVYVNGKSYGICGMKPYICEIPAKQLAENNVLEIRVSNTTANEYLYTKSFDKWENWQLSTYHKDEKIYHKYALQGGLYGPVKILY